MKTLALLGCAALLLLPFALSAGSASAQDDEPTPLQRAMGEINGNMRKMRKLAQDPLANKAALTDALRGVQDAAAAGFAHPAPAAPGVEGDALAIWNAEFRRSMLALADAALETELAVLAGNEEGVAAGFGKLGQLKKSGHDKFQQK